MRTTVDIDAPVLREVKAVQKREGSTLGATVSRLLSEALARRRARAPEVPSFRWISRPMAARIDVADKDAVYAILDAPELAAEG